MAEVTFWEKPGCANNARQKALLVASGHRVEARNLLTEPWDGARLLAFFGDRPVTSWFNPASPRVKSGEVVPADLTEASAIAALLSDPLLIRRPLMEVGARREVGFDVDVVDAWIGLVRPNTRLPEGCVAQRPCAAPE